MIVVKLKDKYLSIINKLTNLLMSLIDPLHNMVLVQMHYFLYFFTNLLDITAEAALECCKLAWKHPWQFFLSEFLFGIVFIDFFLDGAGVSNKKR